MLAVKSVLPKLRSKSPSVSYLGIGHPDGIVYTWSKKKGLRVWEEFRGHDDVPEEVWNEVTFSGRVAGKKASAAIDCPDGWRDIDSDIKAEFLLDMAVRFPEVLSIFKFD